MSRWWNSLRKGTLQVAMLPDHLGFVATGGPGGAETHGNVPVDGRLGASWEAVLGVCGEFLAQPQWQGWRVRIILSDAWVGYRVLPWDPSVLGKKQWDGYARAYFQGAQVGTDESMLAMEPYWPQTNVLACRLPLALITAIREICLRHRQSLESVQPWFVGALNRYRPPTLKGDFWWAAADGFRLVCGLWRAKTSEDGARGWQLLRNQAIGEFDPFETILREELQLGKPAESTGDLPPLIVCCRNSGDLARTARLMLAGSEVRPESLLALAA